MKIHLNERLGDHQGFYDATKEEVEKLIAEFGQKQDYEDAQNDSPTVREFLEMEKTLPTITFIGYIIHKPRDDYRVSVEGFNATNLQAETAIELLKELYADERDCDKNEDGTYNVRFWWD